MGHGLTLLPGTNFTRDMDIMVNQLNYRQIILTSNRQTVTRDIDILYNFTRDIVYLNLILTSNRQNTSKVWTYCYKGHGYYPIHQPANRYKGHRYVFPCIRTDGKLITSIMASWQTIPHERAKRLQLNY